MHEEKQPPPSQPPVMPMAPPTLPAHLQVPHSSEPSQDDRTMAMLVHLLSILTGIIGALILWLVKKDESRFVDHHGKEALNFQLTLLLYVVCLAALAFVIAIVTMGIGMLLIMPVIFLISIGAFVLEILACVAANRGDWHRYPMTIRFIQ